MEQKKVLAQKKGFDFHRVGLGYQHGRRYVGRFYIDVTAALLGYKTIKRRPWCYIEKLLWALIYVPV